MQKLIGFSLIVLSLNAHARWMLPSESDVSILSKTIQIHVAENGSSVVEAVQKIKILNERGRVDWGTWRFDYTPQNVKLQVVDARTETAGAIYKVDKSDIVDTPVNATENGFDESRQVVVPFSQVQVGTIISITTRLEIFRPYLANHFSDRYFFGDYNLQEKGEVHIQSERPLFFQFNDPMRVLDFKKNENKKTKKFAYHIRLAKPVVRRVFEENNSILPDEKIEWFAVSTAETYSEVFSSLLERYKVVLDQPLPEKFESIIRDAKKIKDPIDQINFVLSSVADRVRYMGDWRSVDGALVPRSLAQIVATRFGDCKDLATLTTKMFRLLGLKADVAFIYRGKPPFILPKIPYMGFNHAITTIQLPGRRLWVDATNFQSFADGVFEDIAQRQALILNSEKIELANVELTPPEANVERWEWTMTLKPGQKREDKVNLLLTGSEAISATGAELTYSKKRFETETVANLANISEVISYKFEPYDLRSRIVKPVKMKVVIDQNYQPLQTSMGPAIGIESLRDLSEITRVDRLTRESNLELDAPNTSQFIVNLKNFNVIGDEVQNCETKSPWLDYSLTMNKAKTEIVRTLVTKKYWITAEEVRSPVFAKFQSDLRKCTRGRYLVYKPLE